MVLGQENVAVGAANRPVPWDYGHMLCLSSSVKSMRISLRGFSFSDGDLSTSALSSWNSFPDCFPVQGGLCKPAQEEILFFSTGSVDIPDSWSKIQSNVFTDTVYKTDACQGNGAGRLITVGDSRYEVSLCDILDLNAHFLYDSVNAVMYWRQDSTTILELIFISVASVYFVSALSSNLLHIFKRPSGEALVASGHRTAWLQLGIVVGTVLYCCICAIFVQPGFIVLIQDQILFLQLVLFILVETLGQLGLALPEACLQQKLLSHSEFVYDRGLRIMGVQVPPVKVLMQVLTKPVASDSEGYVSILTTCLMFLSCRVHYSFDTPYLLFLVVIFGTRSVYKLFRVLDESTSPCLVEIGLQVFDVYVYASLLGNGIGASSATPMDASVVLQGTALGTLVLGFLLWRYKLWCDVHAPPV